MEKEVFIRVILKLYQEKHCILWIKRKLTMQNPDVCIKIALNTRVPFHAHKSLLIEEKSTVKQSFDTFYHL